MSAPAGYHTLVPYFTVPSAAEAVRFYAAAFGAVESLRLTLPDGGVCHAEMRVGDSPFMFGDENPAWGNKSPRTLGGTPSGLCVYVPDVDAAFERAVAAGATAEVPPTDEFYGDRTAKLTDPFGHKWTLATRLKTLTPAECQAALDDWLTTLAAA